MSAAAYALIVMLANKNPKDTSFVQPVLTFQSESDCWFVAGQLKSDITLKFKGKNGVTDLAWACVPAQEGSK